MHLVGTGLENHVNNCAGGSPEFGEEYAVASAL